jgi:hypothetical protein
MSDGGELTALAAAWLDSQILLSRHGRYWCARTAAGSRAAFRWAAATNSHATVIADRPYDLAAAPAKQPTLNERNAMSAEPEVGDRAQLLATAAELEAMAELITKFPAEAQLIMGALEDGLTLGPMRVAGEPDSGNGAR